MINHLSYLIFFYCTIFSQNFVDSFIKHYEKTDNYFIEFEYVSKNNNEIIFKNKGELIYSNNKYRITIDDVVFIFDGNKHYNIVKENMEVNVLKSNELSPPSVTPAPKTVGLSSSLPTGARTFGCTS